MTEGPHRIFQFQGLPPLPQTIPRLDNLRTACLRHCASSDIESYGAIGLLFQIIDVFSRLEVWMLGVVEESIG